MFPKGRSAPLEKGRAARSPASGWVLTWRNDTESINRAIEDTLCIGRAHSLRQAAQLADLLGFALLVNARPRARHRARERLKVAAA